MSVQGGVAQLELADMQKRVGGCPRSVSHAARGGRGGEEDAEHYVQWKETPLPPAPPPTAELLGKNHSILYTEGLFLLFPHCIGKCNSLAWELFNVYIYIYLYLSLSLKTHDTGRGQGPPAGMFGQ